MLRYADAYHTVYMCLHIYMYIKKHIFSIYVSSYIHVLAHQKRMLASAYVSIRQHTLAYAYIHVLAHQKRFVVEPLTYAEIRE
jgi:hypothetical protein